MGCTERFPLNAILVRTSAQGPTSLEISLSDSCDVGRYLRTSLRLPQTFLSGISRGLGGLQETGLREAQVTSVSNDDVVLNRNVEQFATGHQLLGDDSIVGRWSGIT